LPELKIRIDGILDQYRNINTAQSTDSNKMDKESARELAKLIAHGAQVSGVQS
jgi:hypothetical protein